MNSYENYYLFARPTFIAGAAQIIDLGNTLFVYNDSPNGDVADYLGIKNDWLVVGEDLYTAMGEADESLPPSDLQPALL